MSHLTGIEKVWRKKERKKNVNNELYNMGRIEWKTKTMRKIDKIERRKERMKYSYHRTKQWRSKERKKDRIRKNKEIIIMSYKKRKWMIAKNTKENT